MPGVDDRFGFAPERLFDVGKTYHGSSGADTQDGTAKDDTFNYGQGGNDTLNGKAGDDTFKMGAAFTAGDHIDGGSGEDTVKLDGETNVTFGATTMVNVENIVLGSGHNYSLVLDQSTVASHASLTIDATALGTGDTLTLNAKAETNGELAVRGGHGTDFVTFAGGGEKIVYGNGGDDFVTFNGGFTTTDAVLGGAGEDHVQIFSTPDVNLAFTALQLSGVEGIDFAPLTTAHNVGFTVSFADNVVAKHQTLTINADSANTAEARLDFDGSAELDGNYVVNALGQNDRLFGGEGNDEFYGGGGNDLLNGGGGHDILDGGTGDDIFVYQDAKDSTGAGFDTAVHFDTHHDTFFISAPVSGIDDAVSTGTVNGATFNDDMAHALKDALHRHHAILFTPDDGDLNGFTFLVVDMDGKAGYRANHDLVIELDKTVHLGDLSEANFSLPN